MNMPVRHVDVGESEIIPSSAPIMPAEPTHPGLARIIWRRRWIMLSALALCIAGGSVYIIRAVTMYRSTSRIYVERSGPKIISLEQGMMTQSKNYLFTQAEMLKSMPILASTLAAPGIRGLKTFANVDNPLGLLKDSLKVKVGKKDEIINVSIDSPYPQEAAQLVNVLVSAYIAYNTEHRRTTASEVLRILQKEKVKGDKELIAKHQAMLEFRQANSSLLLEDEKGNNVLIQGLAKLAEAITVAKLEIIDARGAYESIRAVASDPAKAKRLVEARRAMGVFVSTTNEDARLRDELKNLAQRLAELRMECTEKHPAVLYIRGQIDKLEWRLVGMNENFVLSELSTAQQEYEIARQKEAEIQAYFDAQREKALDLNSQFAQYAVLKSDWEQTKKLVDILYDRIKEIDVTEEAGALNICVLEDAKPAVVPASPRKVRAMAIAIVGGLILGLGMSLLCDSLDRRVRSSEEIAAILGAPVVGVVPYMSGEQSALGRSRKAYQDPSSLVAESFRNIRTTVHFGAPNGRPRMLLVTSLGAGDGKSTLVSNLAISMAQLGQRTLVIDADFRRPRQHITFQVSGEKGLADILAGDGSLDHAVKPTGIDHLDIMPAGPVPTNPSELLHSEALAEILKELAQRYDNIIIDSPPVVPACDARILGAVCGITLLVVRAEKSTRDSAIQAREGLLSVGATILGSVVNAVPPHNSQYGYHSAYSGYLYSCAKGPDRLPAPADDHNRYELKSSDNAGVYVGE